MKPDVLTVKNLCVRLANQPGSSPVVNRLSFEMQQAEVLAVVGESGCGKTKTAEAIMGLLPSSRWDVSADAIELNGADLTRIPSHETGKLRGSEISMIFQEPLTALDPVFSCGFQLCSVFRRHRRMNKREALSAATSILARVGFADPHTITRSYPHQLSGGMRQRVMIAMAMACRPAVLIADEPTTALDVTTQAQVLKQLTELGREYGTAILLITHDLGVVAQYADRALVMSAGKLMEAAPVHDLFHRPGHACTKNLLSFATGTVS